MENQIQITSYTQYKSELDKQLKETAEGFVRIGYLLKLARDTDILSGSGYANVNEFAKAEYNLDKSMVSRFIHINDKFAEGGCSQQLKEQYRGFGYTKLAIMLQLPEEINEELTPDYSKSEITAIKEEVDKERAVSDIELLIEGEKKEQKLLDNNLAKALHQLLEDDTDLYGAIFTAFKEGIATLENIQLCIAPSGEKMYSIRIQGVGRMMLSLKDSEKEVALISVRTSEKEFYSWETVVKCLESSVNTECETMKESWENKYGKEFPKKQEVAPVQPKTEEKKTASKKESKVSKAKEKPKPAAVHKTEKQKYNEKQAEIDRQTKKKLEEMEDEKKMSVLPSEMPVTVHRIRCGKTFFEEILKGIKPFTLRKDDRNYKVGDILEKVEFDDGKNTGRTIRQEVIYKLENYTGLVDGYCILGTRNLDVTENA